MTAFDPYKDLVKILRDRRKNLSMTLAELSRRMGRSVGVPQQLEKGYPRIPQSLLMAEWCDGLFLKATFTVTIEFPENEGREPIVIDLTPPKRTSAVAD